MLSHTASGSHKKKQSNVVAKFGAAPSAKDTTLQVYAPGFDYVFALSAADVHHRPSNNTNVTRLVLCANYDARRPNGSCPMGSRCKFVHADISRAARHEIHVNYAWRSVKEITYERFEPGTTLHVAPPNSKIPSDIMDSDMALKTKALVSKRRPLSHCAHFYFNRTCNLGADCQFVHAVFIDPNAKEHQRAPVPSQLGEGRELQLSKKQREARQKEAQFGLSPKTSCVGMSCTESASCTPRSDTHTTASNWQAPTETHAIASDRDSTTSSARCRGVTARFRYDPYSLQSVRVVVFA